MNVYKYTWVYLPFERLDYEKPFRKFNLPGAGHFTYECMEDTAHDLAGNETIDAFRIAARKVYFRAPASRDCLWYTLEKADEFAARKDDDDSDY